MTQCPCKTISGKVWFGLTIQGYSKSGYWSQVSGAGIEGSHFICSCEEGTIS